MSPLVLFEPFQFAFLEIVKMSHLSHVRFISTLRNVLVTQTTSNVVPSINVLNLCIYEFYSWWWYLYFRSCGFTVAFHFVFSNTTTKNTVTSGFLSFGVFPWKMTPTYRFCQTEQVSKSLPNQENMILITYEPLPLVVSLTNHPQTEVINMFQTLQHPSVVLPCSSLAMHLAVFAKHGHVLLSLKRATNTALITRQASDGLGSQKNWASKVCPTFSS